MQFFQLFLFIAAFIGGCLAGDKEFEYELETHMGQFKDVSMNRILIAGFVKSGKFFSSHQNDGYLVPPSEYLGNIIPPEVSPNTVYTTELTMDIPVEKIKSFHIKWTDRKTSEGKKSNTEFIAVDKVIIKPLYDPSAKPISFCSKEGQTAKANEKLDMKECS